MAQGDRRSRRPKAGAAEPEPGVLGGLSATRPTRMARRGGRDAASGDPAPKPKAAPKAKAAAKTRAATSPKAKAKATPRRPAPTRLEPEAKRPRPVRAGHPGLAAPADKRAAAASRDAEQAGLAGTVVQAAGELASIGVTLGGQLLKRVGEKLPKP